MRPALWRHLATALRQSTHALYYQYDAGGNLTGVDVFGTPLRNWTYDGRGFLKRETRWDKADVRSDLSVAGPFGNHLRELRQSGKGRVAPVAKTCRRQMDRGVLAKNHQYLRSLCRLHTVALDIVGGPLPGPIHHGRIQLLRRQFGQQPGQGKA